MVQYGLFCINNNDLSFWFLETSSWHWEARRRLGRGPAPPDLLAGALGLGPLDGREGDRLAAVWGGSRAALSWGAGEGGGRGDELLPCHHTVEVSFAGHPWIFNAVLLFVSCPIIYYVSKLLSNFWLIDKMFIQNDSIKALHCLFQKQPPHQLMHPQY